VIRPNTKDRPNPILVMALGGIAFTCVLGTRSQALQPSPQRTQYPSDVVVTETFRSFTGGRALPVLGNTAALVSRLGNATTASRDLGLALMPGLEIRQGHTVQLFGAQPAARGATPPSFSKLITLHPVAYRGVPLAPGSDVLSIATATGRLLLVRERNLPQVVDGINPTVDRDTGIRMAIEVGRTHEMPADAEVRDSELEVFVDRSGGRLAWRVRVASNSLTAPWARDIWIAAIGNPIVLADREVIYYGHNGHVTAIAFPTSPVAGTTSQDLEAAIVTRTGSDGGTAMTDGSGRYSFPTGTGNATLTVGVSGLPIPPTPQPHSVVDNVPGNEISASATGSASVPVDLSLNATTAEELAQTSAFIWVNRAHDFVQDFLPSDAWAPMPTRVNIANSCNAFFDGTSLNFFQAGGGCVNTAYSDVVMHEYGHAVDQTFGGILDHGYSEGFGDSLAVMGTQQPCVGRDFFGAGTCLRPATDVILWPPSSGEDVHAIGRRYVGFVWALVTELQAVYSPAASFEVARQLVLGAAAANPANIPDAVRLSFIADDDDGDLTTCSAHQQMLAAAADSRHIPRPPDCTPSPTAGRSITPVLYFLFSQEYTLPPITPVLDLLLHSR
jgi:hypothetical protein